MNTHSQYCHTKACHDRDNCALAQDGNGKKLMFGDGDDKSVCRQFIPLKESQPCAKSS